MVIKSSKRLQVEAQLDCLMKRELVTIGKVIQAIDGENVNLTSSIIQCWIN